MDSCSADEASPASARPSSSATNDEPAAVLAVPSMAESIDVTSSCPAEVIHHRPPSLAEPSYRAAHELPGALHALKLASDSIVSPAKPSAAPRIPSLDVSELFLGPTPSDAVRTRILAQALATSEESKANAQALALAKQQARVEARQRVANARAASAIDSSAVQGLKTLDDKARERLLAHLKYESRRRPRGIRMSVAGGAGVARMMRSKSRSTPGSDGTERIRPQPRTLTKEEPPQQKEEYEHEHEHEQQATAPAPSMSTPNDQTTRSTLPPAAQMPPPSRTKSAAQLSGRPSQAAVQAHTPPKERSDSRMLPLNTKKAEGRHAEPSFRPPSSSNRCGGGLSSQRSACTNRRTVAHACSHTGTSAGPTNTRVARSGSGSSSKRV